MYQLPNASISFLRICRQVNDEAYNILYGLNRFIYHAVTNKRHRRVAQARYEQDALPSSTCRKMSEIHLVLGGELNKPEKALLLRALPHSTRILITVAILLDKDSRRGYQSRAKLLQEFPADCQEIALARSKSGGLTLWDDLQEQDTCSMLRGALPEGYQEGSCPDFRDWWRRNERSCKSRYLLAVCVKTCLQIWTASMRSGQSPRLQHPKNCEWTLIPPLK